MKKILIDIEKCYSCENIKDKNGCVAKCSYFYNHSHVWNDKQREESKNRGYEKFFSKVLQYIICRRCEDAFCISSCPNESLFKDDKGVLHKSLFRCTSCKSCMIGCPFGTIYEEVLEFKSSQCDFCIPRRTDENPPLCTTTCPEGAIKYLDIEPNEKENIYQITDNLLVHAIKWVLKEPVNSK